MFKLHTPSGFTDGTLEMNTLALFGKSLKYLAETTEGRNFI